MSEQDKPQDSEEEVEVLARSLEKGLRFLSLYGSWRPVTPEPKLPLSLGEFSDLHSKFKGEFPEILEALSPFPRNSKGS